MQSQIEIDLATIKTSDLIPFFLEYINKHTYFSSKNIATAYLFQKYEINDKNHRKEIRKISYRIGCYLIRKAGENNLIAHFTNRTYKKCVDHEITEKDLLQ